MKNRVAWWIGFGAASAFSLLACGGDDSGPGDMVLDSGGGPSDARGEGMITTPGADAADGKTDGSVDASGQGADAAMETGPCGIPINSTVQCNPGSAFSFISCRCVVGGVDGGGVDVAVPDGSAGADAASNDDSG